MQKHRFALFSAAALSLAGCAVPTGGVTVEASGEESAVDGFPATELADGWAITFSKFLVSVGHVKLTQEGAEAELDGVLVIDLHQGEQTLGELADVPAGRWDVAFDIEAPEHGPTTGTDVDAADAEAMHEAGFAYWVEGSAAKDERTVQFQLGVPLEAKMTECTNGIDGSDGMVVEAGATANAEITLHIEHLFYDKLGTHSGVELRFDAIADAAGDDNLVTNADLEAVLVSSLADYEPGSSDVTTLLDFVTQAAVEMPHFNGEGLCTINGEAHDHDHDHDHD